MLIDTLTRLRDPEAAAPPAAGASAPADPVSVPPAAPQAPAVGAQAAVAPPPLPPAGAEAAGAAAGSGGGLVADAASPNVSFDQFGLQSPLAAAGPVEGEERES